MDKRELKKMDDEHLKSLYEAMKQDAVKAIEAGTILFAIHYLTVALKAEDVLFERGIEV